MDRSAGKDSCSGNACASRAAGTRSGMGRHGEALAVEIGDLRVEDARRSPVDIP